jgi:hypothetical protein
MITGTAMQDADTTTAPAKSAPAEQQFVQRVERMRIQL